VGRRRGVVEGISEKRFIAMTLDERVQSLIDGKASLEFESITFESQGRKTHLDITGRGHVALLRDGTFEVSCEVARPSTPIPAGTWAIKTPPAGSFFSDDDYFNMEARDCQGNIWRAERLILPEVDFFPPFLLSRVSCRTGYLCIRNPDCVAANNMLIEYSSDNQDNWKILLDRQLRIYLDKCRQRVTLTVGFRRASIVVAVQSDTPIPVGLEHKLTEALSFVFDESLDILLVTRVLSESRDIFIGRSRIYDFDPAPIIVFRSDFTEYFALLAKLIELFVSYIWDHKSEDDSRYHPCTYFLRLVRQPPHIAIDGEILTASVVAEGIAWLAPFESAVQSSELLDAKHEFQQTVRTSAFSEQTKKRILGSLQSVGQPSIKDRFSKLLSEARIREEDFNAWKRLRNPYAHLQPNAFADKENVKDRYSDLLRIRNLIRCTVLACIGYEGKYVNYAALRYPIENYPFSTSLRQSASLE
jgi:hypothetical protein